MVVDKERAIEIAKKYHFVTDLTSLVVTNDPLLQPKAKEEGKLEAGDKTYNSEEVKGTTSV